jgi:hypothetical protein
VQRIHRRDQAAPNRIAIGDDQPSERRYVNERRLSGTATGSVNGRDGRKTDG